jgi:hypothetical protein
MSESTKDGLARYEMAPLEKREAAALIKKPRQEKVMFIYHLATSLRYERGRTSRDLALIWGCSAQEVAAMAKDATVIITQVMKGSMLGPEELRYELMGKLDFIMNDAMVAEKQVVTKQGDIVTLKAPDRNAAIHAIKATASLFGIEKAPPPPTLPGGEYGALTKEQLEEEVRKTLLRMSVNAEGVGTDVTDEVEEDPEPRALHADEGRVSEGLVGSGGSGGGEHHGGRKRSTDLVHGRPGVPSGAPKRLRKAPKAFREQPGRADRPAGSPEEGPEEGDG